MDGSALARLLESGPILSDGGMGTSLVERGVAVGAGFEVLNLDEPALVEGVHRAFVEAGARLVLTNTYGANRYALGRGDLTERVGELNRRGAELARRGRRTGRGIRGAAPGRSGPVRAHPAGGCVRGLRRAGGRARRRGRGPRPDRDPVRPERDRTGGRGRPEGLRPGGHGDLLVHAGRPVAAGRDAGTGGHPARRARRRRDRRELRAGARPGAPRDPPSCARTRRESPWSPARMRAARFRSAAA